ncbi:MAG TPA: hypothetical protein VM890_06120 [Longimicrobium sp.]|jgi:hypothetical protein|nr:hypothetical protein [Longimicrobium sp.]
MAKLKLSLEHLTVESFASEEPAADARGTVHGRQDTDYETCAGYTCVYAETCQNWRTCYMDCTMDCTFRRC